MSNLLLGGVLNILQQHDTIEHMDGRIKSVEQKILTDKLRIESLDNWVLQQDAKIQKLSEKESHLDINKEQKEFKDLQERILSIESDMINARVDRRKNDEYDLKKDDAKKYVFLKCEHCEEKFTKAIEVETHMTELGLMKKHSCEVCGEGFYLKWRLNKHKQMHSEDHRSHFCHFYNNNIECPFNQVGCMFQHTKSGPCPRKNCTRNLCEFENVQGDIEVVVEALDDEEEREGESENEDQFECSLCGCTFVDNVELGWHIEANHMSRQNLIQANGV